MSGWLSAWLERTASKVLWQSATRDDQKYSRSPDSVEPSRPRPGVARRPLAMASKDRYHHSEPYELSQDLIAKQLEVLEKKYGGSRTAKEAALTIQRAFRR